MKKIRTVFFILTASVLLFGCNSDQQQVATSQQPYSNVPENANVSPGDIYDDWAKENFDLQRVGPLLERSRTPQEFESYLNRRDGIDNLDLNGDGYADYISVEEFQDRGDYERGLSLYTRFGPDEIQELGTIVFYRDDVNYPGARILLTGNDQIYGDNVYYETNWLERTLNIVSYLFTDHQYYRSPYYYDYYPDDYVVYEVVDTPIYRTRIEQLYPQPVFVYTTAPTILEKVKIKSPNYGRSMEKVYAKLAKPSKAQAEFKKNNPGKPHFEKPGKGPKNEGPNKGEDKEGDRGKGQEKQNPGQQPHENQGSGKPQKQDNPNKGGNPDKGGKPDKGGNPNKGGNGKGKKNG